MPNYEIAPAMQADQDRKRDKDYDPRDFQNTRNMIQVLLMGRYPQGEEAWTERNAAAFGRLFDTDDGFRSLAVRAHRNADEKALQAIKDRLEEETTQ